MAGDWLKMEAATPDKPEVLAITVRMGWDDPDLTVGKLFRVWRWFDQHTTDGNAVGVTLALLDRIAGVTGFGAAMESVNWMTVSDAGLQLPHFGYHCGKTAKERAQTAKRVAEFKSNGKGNGASVTETVTDALPREEKRREEKKEQKQKTSAPDAPALPALIQIPLINGTEFPITKALVDEYAACYPAVDVMGELRKMRAWCVSNPKNRKTASGVTRFMNSWLAKAQNECKRAPDGPTKPAPGSADDFFQRAI